MRTRALAITLATTLTTTLALSACSLSSGGDDASASKASDRVVLVTHDSFHLPDALKTRFEKESGYELVLRQSGDAGSLTNKLVLTKDDNEVVQFDGPVLELMTETRRRFDRRLALLGPDIIKDDFDADEVVRRARADDPTRGLGDALLDQRIVAGIGNLWKAEGCWLAELDPWRRLQDVSDDELHRVLDELRPRMQESARDGNQARHRKIYNNTGRACPRCATKITARGQGDDNRTTYWCPGCQT